MYQQHHTSSSLLITTVPAEVDRCGARTAITSGSGTSTRGQSSVELCRKVSKIERNQKCIRQAKTRRRSCQSRSSHRGSLDLWCLDCLGGLREALHGTVSQQDWLEVLGQAAVHD